MLTLLEINGRTDARHSLPATEELQGGAVCTATVLNPLSERASSNIALLYGGILSRPQLQGWNAPQRAWSST